MVANPSMWMFDTLDECCGRHYKYNEAGCKGTSASGTDEWYVVWGNPAVCVKNCEEGTGTGCGGFLPGVGISSMQARGSVAVSV